MFSEKEKEDADDEKGKTIKFIIYINVPTEL